jgi:hypothetical protein
MVFNYLSKISQSPTHICVLMCSSSVLMRRVCLACCARGSACARRSYSSAWRFMTGRMRHCCTACFTAGYSSLSSLSCPGGRGGAGVREREGGRGLGRERSGVEIRGRPVVWDHHFLGLDDHVLTDGRSSDDLIFALIIVLYEEGSLSFGWDYHDFQRW